MAATAPSMHAFEKRVNEAPISKSDVNQLVMDYLINEGYPSAAEKFAMEANIEQPPDESNILLRVQIRDSIYRGDIERAIDLIGEASPELLDKDNNLHFSLLRLQLVELIKASFASSSSKPDPAAVEKAILFARDNLAPYASLSTNFKNDLEKAMALLIIPQEIWAQPSQPAATANAASSNTATSGFGQLSELVDPSLRKKVAKDVNEAILASQGQKPDANVRHLVRTRAWAEKLARDKKVDLPAKLNLGLDGENENGQGGDTDMAGASTSDVANSGRRTRATSGISDAVMTGGSAGAQRH